MREAEREINILKLYLIFINKILIYFILKKSDQGKRDCLENTRNSEFIGR